MVEKALAGIGGNPDSDGIGEDTGATGDRAAVSTRFANDGGRLARDRGFIHAGRTLDHVAVAGNDLSCLDDDDIILSQRLCRDHLA